MIRQQRTLLLLLGSLLPLEVSYSQAITARVTGIVSDPSDAAVSGARVELRNAETNAARVATTDTQGSYEFSFVPVGAYTLLVEAPGFQKSAVSRFQLSVDQVARLDVKLAVGQTTESITVLAGALLMQTENATVGTVIDAQKVVELPLNGRSFIQLALLTPGVNPGTPGSITVRRLRGSVGQAVGMSANGARDTQNRFYYDGIEAMDLDSYSFSFSPSIDGIQEFKVQSSTYSADVGGAPGGQVNLTTKSGTNSPHGTLWWFNRNDAFTALNGFQPRVPGAKPPRLNRNQYGANLGGPVFLPKLYNGRDKTFFFFNWESGRQVAGSFGGTATVPPAPFRQGDFSSSSTIIYDPQTRQPFPGNRIPAGRILPYAQKFLDQFVPAANTSEPGINYRGPRAAAPITQDQYTARVDHIISQKDSISGSYIYNIQADDTVPVYVFDTRGNRARTQHASLTETHIFGTSTVNEVRAGWHRFFEHEFFGTTDKPQFDVGNIIGIPGVTKRSRDFGPPTFSAGYSLPAVRGIGPRDRLNQLWQVSDNISLRKGTHNIKAGALIARRNWTFDEAVDPRGSFGFNGTVTAAPATTGARDNQFAEFLLGLATSAQVSVEPFATRMNNWWHAYYFQDDWKVTPNLTLNWGLRYEYYKPPVQRGKATNFDLNGFVPARQIFHGFPDIPDTTDRPAALVYADRNDFGPRFGFAYQVPKIRDFVVRGGYGMYYTPEITNSWTTLTLNPPIVQTFTFTGSANNPVRVDQAFASQGTTSVGLFGSGALDPNVRTTYTQQWNLTLQKKLPGQIFLDTGYVGSKGTKLTASFDGNRPIEVVTPGPTTPSIASRRPFQGFNNINTTKSIGNSTYHSLQMKAERRAAKGLTLIGAYTWSKSLSNADISSVGGGTFLGGIQDYFNLAGSKAPSIFDIRHRLSIAAIYDVPLFVDSRNAWVRGLLGGWQLGTIITEQTGFAAALSNVVDTTGTGIASRPDAVGGPAMLPRDQRTRARWFNTAAFARPQLGRFGTAARHPIYLPGLNQVDASVNKNFRFFESHQVQFRAEFFNFFNHVNLGSPGLNISDPDNFGRVTSTAQGAAGMPGDARIVQFGLKYSF